MKYYDSLLNIKINYQFYLLISGLLFLFLLCLAGNIKWQDTQRYQGICENDLCYLKILTDNLDTIKNGEFLKIDKIKYYYQIISLGDLLVDETYLVNYNIVTIKINKSYNQREVVNIIIYAPKEKIWQKIKKILRKE